MILMTDFISLLHENDKPYQRVVAKIEDERQRKREVFEARVAKVEAIKKLLNDLSKACTENNKELIRQESENLFKINKEWP